MNKINIYGLLNPLTNQYFYVGITSQKLSKRLSGHMSTISVPALRWWRDYFTNLFD